MVRNVAAMMLVPINVIKINLNLSLYRAGDRFFFFFMKPNRRHIFYLFFPLLSLLLIGHDTEKHKSTLAWEEGYLDIHFIHNGRGNTSFMVFPDGTTLLYDAGDSKKGAKHPNYPPLTDKKSTAGDRIIDYIHFFSPKDTIDYALISHFHNDHYGKVENETPYSKKGDYRLTGITAVGDSIPFKHLIDRAFPEYNYPKNLRKRKGKEDKTIMNYLKFIIHHQQQSGLNVAQLTPGSNKQITLGYKRNDYPTFSVRNVKCNGDLWTGEEDKVGRYPFDPPLVNEEGYYNENPLSLALKIDYGKFDYYVGGDLPGVNDYPDYDIETPIGNIIGEVDALTLNHHGYKDATNRYFLQKTKPQVIAHQSLHDPHFAENVQLHLKESGADVFSPYASEKMKKWHKKLMKKSYKSTRGHFFIRVYPQGETFDVFVLNESTDGYTLKEKFGPYKSN